MGHPSYSRQGPGGSRPTFVEGGGIFQNFGILICIKSGTSAKQLGIIKIEGRGGGIFPTSDPPCTRYYAYFLFELRRDLASHRKDSIISSYGYIKWKIQKQKSTKFLCLSVFWSLSSAWGLLNHRTNYQGLAIETNLGGTRIPTAQLYQKIEQELHPHDLKKAFDVIGTISPAITYDICTEKWFLCVKYIASVPRGHLYHFLVSRNSFIHRRLFTIFFHCMGLRFASLVFEGTFVQFVLLSAFLVLTDFIHW